MFTSGSDVGGTFLFPPPYSLFNRVTATSLQKVFHKEPCKCPNPPSQQPHWQNAMTSKQRQRQKLAQGQGLKAAALPFPLSRSRQPMQLTELMLKHALPACHSAAGLSEFPGGRVWGKRGRYGGTASSPQLPQPLLVFWRLQIKAQEDEGYQLPFGHPFATEHSHISSGSSGQNEPRGAFLFLKCKDASLEQQRVEGGKEVVCKVSVQGRICLLWGTSDEAAGEVEQEVSAL